MTDSMHSQFDNNWSAAGVVGMFDAVHRGRDRKRYRLRVFLWCLIVAACFSVPLGITWINYQQARQVTLTEEFMTRRLAMEQLANRNNPVVDGKLTEADRLRATANQSSIHESVSSLREAILRLSDAMMIDGRLQTLRPLHMPLGVTLNETPWMVSSMVIDQKVKSLARTHVEISQLLDAGDVALAEQKLTTLLANLGMLQRDNVEAMITSQTRQNWVRLNTSVPDRLKDDSELAVVRGIGTHAEQGWEAGDWINARALYGQAADTLHTFLESRLDLEEKGQLLASDTEVVARLETEKIDFAKLVESIRQEKQSLNDQLATTNSQRLTAEKLVTALASECDTLKQSAAADKAELDELRPFRQQLADTNVRLKKAQEDLSSLNTAKTEADLEMLRMTVELSGRTAAVAALVAAAADGNDNSVIVQISATLAAIESKLTGGTLKLTDDESSMARALLAVALQQYDQAVAERTKAIAEKSKPDSSKVQAIDKAIWQAEGTLRIALKPLDEPQARQFEALLILIASADADLQQILKQVLPEHPEAVKLKKKIDGLKSQQDTLKPAHDRFQGDVVPTAETLVSLSREHVNEFVRQRRVAEFLRLKAEGKVPSAADMQMVAVSPGAVTIQAHEVRITRPFFVGKYEVTIAQALVWLNSPGVVFKDEWIDLSDSDCAIRKNGNRFARNSSTRFASSDEQPMQNISHFGAIAFCEWCSKQDSRFKYRLPTEAEWEYMARAGSTSSYPWGDSCNGTEANVNGTNPYGTTNTGPYKQVTTTVGSYPPNAWGVHDTVGNTWEWCADWYDAGYYAVSLAIDPKGPKSGSSRVLRGGSWYPDAIYARSSYRYYRTPDFRYYNIGFRVVAE